MPAKKAKSSPSKRTRTTARPRQLKNKFPLFTLFFIIGALVITVLAVQQQQILVQNAAKKDCITETQDDTDSKLSKEDRQATRAARKDSDTTEKPTKEPKPCKQKDGTDNTSDNNDKNKKNDNKDTKKDKNDRKNDDKNNGGRNRGIDPVRLGCTIFPGMPFCRNLPNTGSNNAGQPCGTSGGGQGRNGQENTSHNPGTVDLGNINDDDTTDTTVTVNGKEITGDNENSTGTDDGNTTIIDDTNFQDGQDINTGGQTGGSHSTIINIDRNGQDDYDDQSGSDGNANANAKSGKNNNGGCDNGNNNADRNGDNKSGGNNSGNNRNNNGNTSSRATGNNGSVWCRFMPWLLFCR